ncbi:MAG: CopG family antitoxin [Candidatus Desantisbacteria bacterium]
MNANKKKDAIPVHFRSEEDAGRFWDTHSAADHWDNMKEVEMEFDIKRHKFLVPLNDQIYQLAKKRAEVEHSSVSQIVNTLLAHDLVGAVAR